MSPRCFPRLLISVILFLSVTNPVCAWEPIPLATPLIRVNDALFASGVWLAVGECGSIQRAIDGENWTAVTPVTGDDLLTVFHTGTQFLIGGENGLILRSADGLNWTIARSSTQLPVKSFEFLNGRFYALAGGTSTSSSNVHLLRSDLGNDWDVIFKNDSASGTDDFKFGSIAYLRGSYQAFGYNGVIWTSADAEHWKVDNTRTTGVTFPNRIQHFDGRSIIYTPYQNGASAAAYSDDGVTWVPIPYWPLIGDIAFFKDRYIAVAASVYNNLFSNMLTSADLINWTPISNYSSYAIAHSADKACSFGAYGYLSSSDDGNHWRIGNRFNKNPAAFADGAFLAIQGNYLFRSTDAMNWVQSRLPSGFEGDAIQYTGGRYFVTQHGSYSYATSTDFAHWTVGTLPNIPTGNKMAHALGKFFLPTENGKLYSSTNGIDWAFETNATAVAFNGSKLLAIGKYSTSLRVWISNDGSNWTYSLPNGQPAATDVAYGNGVFVIVGNDIRSSGNGTSWTKRTIPNPPIGGFKAVDFVNGTFIAKGCYGPIFTSSDGLSWEDRSYPAYEGYSDPFSVSFGNGTYFLTGSVALTAENLGDWTVAADFTEHDFLRVRYLNGRFLAISKKIDSTAVLELWESPDGRNWQKILIRYSQGDAPDIIYGNGQYVLIDDYHSYLSTDLKSWTDHDFGVFHRIRAGAFWNNRYYAGHQGGLLASPDGIQWTEEALPDPDPYLGIDILDILATPDGLTAVGINWADHAIYHKKSQTEPWTLSTYDLSGPRPSCIAYGNGKHVISGAPAFLKESSNGIDWTVAYEDPSIHAMVAVVAMIYTDHRFYAIVNGNRIRRFSEDTLDSFGEDPLGVYHVRSIAAGGGRVVAVGERSTVLLSDLPIDIPEPGSLTQTRREADSIDISWPPPGGSPSGFIVEYIEIETSSWKIDKTPEWRTLGYLPATQTSVSLTNLKLHTTYQVRVRALFQGGASDYRIFAGDELPTTLRPIEAWRLRHFGDSGGGPDGADDQDPDQDGLSNLLEYAMLTDPLVNAPTSPIGFSNVWNFQGRNSALEFPVSANLSDIDYIVEASPDCLTWTVFGELVRGGRFRPTPETQPAYVYQYQDLFYSDVAGSQPERTVRVVIHCENRDYDRYYMRLRIVMHP